MRERERESAQYLEGVHVLTDFGDLERAVFRARARLLFVNKQVLDLHDFGDSVTLFAVLGSLEYRCVTTRCTVL